MYITLSDGHTYRLFFRHYYETKVFVEMPIESDDVNQATVKTVKQPVVTECFIKRDENGKLIDVGKGIAMKNPKDNANKETARQVSLARAIEGFVVADKQIVLDAYKNRGQIVAKCNKVA